MITRSVIFLYSKSIIIAITTALLISCSQEIVTGTVTDVEGNVYQTVKIGNQWWMAENLKVTKYRNGVSIPDISGESKCSDYSTGAFSYYENDPGNVTTYGLLYNWYATVDSQGICPEGWHVPNDEEWRELEMHLGLNKSEAEDLGPRGKEEGGKLKATGTSHWQSPNTGATNITGFSALPSGARTCYGGYDGDFYYLGEKATMWSSSEHDDIFAWIRNLDFDGSYIVRRIKDKDNGFVIRCIQD